MPETEPKRVDHDDELDNYVVSSGTVYKVVESANGNEYLQKVGVVIDGI